MKKNVNLKIDPKREAKRVAFGLISAVIMAVNIKIFVRAGGLYPGGFNGVTRLVQTIFEQFLGIPLPFAPVSLILNAIPAIVSFKAIGKKFTLNTSMIIVVSSILTDFAPSVPITQDILLISIFGGLINGTAVSLALIGGSSTGGTDFIAVYFAEKKNKDVWNYILMGNGVGTGNGRNSFWLGQGAVFYYFPVYIYPDHTSAVPSL